MEYGLGSTDYITDCLAMAGYVDVRGWRSSVSMEWKFLVHTANCLTYRVLIDSY